MPTPDLSTAEAILRELLDVRVNRAQLTAEDVRNRQQAAWKAARKVLGVKGGGKAKADKAPADEA